MKYILITCALLFALSGCKSLNDLYEKGDYLTIINRLESKAKKGKLDRKEKSLLIKSAGNYFREINDEAFASLEGIDFEAWDNSRSRLLKSESKREEIVAFPQIRDGDLDSSSIDKLLPILNSKLRDHYMVIYDENLLQYKQYGHRRDIVEVYFLLQQLEEYEADKTFIDSMFQYARTEAHVEIEVDFNADPWNNYEFRQHFERTIDFDDDLLHTFTSISSSPDYELELGAEIVDTDEYRDVGYEDYEERIIDGYNEVVDTSGNVESIPIYKNVTARIKVIKFQWTVDGDAYYVLRKNASIISSDQYSHLLRDEDVIFVFDSGDRRAVPSNINLSNDDRIEYDFDDMIEETFEKLADRMNNDMEIKEILLRQ